MTIIDKIRKSYLTAKFNRLDRRVTWKKNYAQKCLNDSKKTLNEAEKLLEEMKVIARELALL